MDTRGGLEVRDIGMDTPENIPIRGHQPRGREFATLLFRDTCDSIGLSATHQAIILGFARVEPGMQEHVKQALNKGTLGTQVQGQHQGRSPHALFVSNRLDNYIISHARLIQLRHNSFNQIIYSHWLSHEATYG